MDGKIALEEHWAMEETLASNMEMARVSDWMAGVRRRLLDVQDRRLAEMDRHGIELTILSLCAPAVQAIPDIGEAIEIAKKANDALADEIARRPDRFAGFAALPMQDPDAAIAELTRCVKELGFKGALVNGFTQKDVPDSAVYFDIPEYRPFWAVVQELDVPFYLHPRLQIPTRVEAYEGHPWLYAPAWDYAAQTSIHALRLICSGLFDEFPRLQIVLGHLGERIPYDLWRIDNLMQKVPNRYPAEHSIGTYFTTNFHLTTSGHFHDSTFTCAIAEVGVERIMFSVDYPFEEMERAARWFDGTELSDGDRLKIGRTNAVQLFKLALS